MKKLISLALMLCLLTAVLTGCGGSSAEATQLKFADSASLETIQKLDGKAVTITGYMATLSPLTGDYIYLMNLPYQSCPFCVPNTQQLSNTMAVYAAKGVKFDFTDRPIKITGTMKIEDCMDDYGYSYNYRIVDAKYEVVDLSSVSQEYALYQSLASDGVIGDINSMFDYLLFLCQWNEYTSSYTDESGQEVSFYLFPGDVSSILADDGPYGYAAEASDDYYPGLIERVNAISSTDLGELTAILEDAQAVAEYARGELDSSNYSYDEAADKYVLNDAEGLIERFQSVYARFSNWLASYEL